MNQQYIYKRNDKLSIPVVVKGIKKLIQQKTYWKKLYKKQEKKKHNIRERDGVVAKG